MEIDVDTTEESYTKDPVKAGVTFTKFVTANPLTLISYSAGVVSGMLGMFGWIVFNKFLAHLL